MGELIAGGGARERGGRRLAWSFFINPIVASGIGLGVGGEL